MTEPSSSPRTLHDPATGRDVELVYAIPPQLLGETAAADDSGISPAELLARLCRGWRLIAVVTVLGAALGLAIALTTPNRYTASATALPPSDKSGGGMLSQYAGLAAAAGIQLPGAPSSSVDAIMAILNSRRLHQPLIERFQLAGYYNRATKDDLLKAFDADFDSRLDKKSNTISIAVTNRDAQRAADIANAAADLLQVTFNEINQSSATREREFLESRLKQAESDMSIASKALADFQSERGAVEIESQTKATVEAVARLQGELIGQQIELKALLASAASPDNPATQLLQQRVNAMTSELQRLLGQGGDGPGVFIGLGRLPELGIAYLERYRAVKKYEAVLTALTTQVETARFNEVRTSEVVTIIDRAFVPERKSGPPRAQICIAATLLGGLAGCALVLLLPALRELRRTTFAPVGNA
jgi:tyrosine-protein kinase Etk/Wzc